MPDDNNVSQIVLQVNFVVPPHATKDEIEALFLRSVYTAMCENAREVVDEIYTNNTAYDLLRD